MLPQLIVLMVYLALSDLFVLLYFPDILMTFASIIRRILVFGKYFHLFLELFLFLYSIFLNLSLQQHQIVSFLFDFFQFGFVELIVLLFLLPLLFYHHLQLVYLGLLLFLKLESFVPDLFLVSHYFLNGVAFHFLGLSSQPSFLISKLCLGNFSIKNLNLASPLPPLTVHQRFGIMFLTFFRRHSAILPLTIDVSRLRDHFGYFLLRIFSER